ncbi:hypothetical protein BDW22DRAFT_1349379 [Trametopsis cervina]|nr:hypothetical protein BDW22DRAFT_1349379 [Trametopsis cervina]
MAEVVYSKMKDVRMSELLSNLCPHRNSSVRVRRRRSLTRFKAVQRKPRDQAPHQLGMFEAPKLLAWRKIPWYRNRGKGEEDRARSSCAPRARGRRAALQGFMQDTNRAQEPDSGLGTPVNPSDRVVGARSMWLYFIDEKKVDTTPGRHYIPAEDNIGISIGVGVASD